MADDPELSEEDKRARFTAELQRINAETALFIAQSRSEPYQAVGLIAAGVFLGFGALKVVGWL